MYIFVYILITTLDTLCTVLGCKLHYDLDIALLCGRDGLYRLYGMMTGRHDINWAERSVVYVLKIRHRAI